MPSKTFRDYLDSNKYSPILKSASKSIQYIEDLAPAEFVEVIKNLPKMVVSEKLDGTSFAFGLDDDGCFYTTRSGKGSADSIKFAAKDWGISAAANGFKAAHAALKQHSDLIAEVLAPGEAVDIEILFGRQPNTIVYGLDGFNYIAFLKMTAGTNASLEVDQSKIQKLASKFKDIKSDVRTINVDTTDGITLSQGPTVTNWRFTTPAFVKSADFYTPEVKSALAKMETFLAAKNTGMSALVGNETSNEKAATISIAAVKSDKRDEAKKMKADALDEVLKKHMLPIKQILLDKFVRSVQPKLQDRDVEPSEDLGMEGIVILDPKSLEQYKIVDKELFATLNKFNYEVRNNIRGMARTDEDDAPLASRGGYFGTAKIRIARLFNIPGLGKGYSVKRVIAKFKKETPEDTAAAIAASCAGADYFAFKSKIKAILKSTSIEIDEFLTNFKEHYTEYTVKLPDGTKIGYTAEIVHRTLLVFAETQQSIKRLSDSVSKAKNMEDLVTALYGRQIKQQFGNSPDSGEDTLTEDEGAGAPDGGDACDTSCGTFISAIAPVPSRLFKGKVIRRIKKITKLKNTKRWTKIDGVKNGIY